MLIGKNNEELLKTHRRKPQPLQCLARRREYTAMTGQNVTDAAYIVKPEIRWPGVSLRGKDAWN